MRMLTFSLAAALLGAPILCAADEAKFTERLDDSASLLSEVMSAPDRSIPQDLLNKASCIVLVPGLKKGAFVVGAKYGRGFAICRGANGQGWGPPAAISIEGGSFGLQIGVSSSDVILLVMNEGGMKHLMNDKFTIGGDATAAAGPVGRNATAQTDAFMSAEILSWSRSRGAFAGVSLDGATLRSDTEQNKAMYGKPWSTRQILSSGARAPEASKKLLNLLTKYSMRKVG